MFFHQIQDAFSSILCFSIKYKPPRAPGALKTASSCLTLYIGCYRTSLEKTFLRSKNPKTSWSHNVIFSSKTITFVIAFSSFPSNIRGLQPQASHCNVPWMVARIWPGDIFFKTVLRIQVSGRPLGSGGGIMVENHFYTFSEFVKVRQLCGVGLIKVRLLSQISGKTLLQLSDFVKVRKIYGVGLTKVRLFSHIVWERTFATAPIQEK